jgi:hypothetical protein
MSYTRKDNIKKPQTFYKFYKQNAAGLVHLHSLQSSVAARLLVLLYYNNIYYPNCPVMPPCNFIPPYYLAFIEKTLLLKHSGAKIKKCNKSIRNCKEII